LASGADGRLVDAVDGVPGRGAQPDRYGHGFLVVEQQRRHGGAGGQAVAPGRAQGRLHRIAEVT